MLNLAALLLFLTGLAHSCLGERYLLMRLFARGDLPRLLGSREFFAGTLRFVWHLLTLVWWGIAALLLLATRQTLDTRTVLEVFAATAALSGLFPLFFTRGRHLSWIVFFVVAGLLGMVARAA